MKELIVAFLDALIPLGGAMLLLFAPQLFTKKDLKAEENRKIARGLRLAGWVLLAAGILIFIANVGTSRTGR